MRRDIQPLTNKFHASTLPKVLSRLFLGEETRHSKKFVSAVLLRDSREDFRVRDYAVEGWSENTRQVIATTGSVIKNSIQLLRIAGDNMWRNSGVDHGDLSSLVDMLWAIQEYELDGLSHYPHSYSQSETDKSSASGINVPSDIMSETVSKMSPYTQEEWQNVTDQDHTSYDGWASLPSMKEMITTDFKEKGFANPPTEAEQKKRRSYNRQGFAYHIKEPDTQAFCHQLLLLRREYA